MFFLADIGAQTITIRATNQSGESVEFSSPAEVSESGGTLLSAEELAGLIKSSRMKHNAEMIFSGGNVAIGKKSKAIDSRSAGDFPCEPFLLAERYQGLNEMDYPLLENSFDIDTKKLREISDRVGYACSDSPTKMILDGIHFQGNEAAATDGYRLASVSWDGLEVSEAFVFPAKSLETACKLFDGSVKVEHNMSWIQIRGSVEGCDLVFRCKTSSHDCGGYRSIASATGFPKYEQLIPNRDHADRVLGVWRPDWLTAINMIEELHGQNTNITITEFDSKTCVMCCKGLPVSGVRVPYSLSVGKVEQEFFIMVDSTYLKQAIDSCSENEIALYMNSNRNPIVISCDPSETHLVMPILPGASARSSHDEMLAAANIMKSHFPIAHS